MSAHKVNNVSLHKHSGIIPAFSFHALYSSSDTRSAVIGSRA